MSTSQQKRGRTIGMVLGILLLLLLPWMVGQFLSQALFLVGLYVMMGLGLNIVVGYAGLLDLGYAAFFAIGAYTTGILTWPGHPMQWNFWIVIWAAVIVAALCGIIIGTPTLRLRGDYLAIVTLAFGEIVPVVMRNLGSVTIGIGPWRLVSDFNLTNGVQGMNPVGRPEIWGLRFSFDPTPWYYLILIIAALIILTSTRLQNSRLGRAWMALREDETAADCMGVDPIRTKLLAFAIGASFSGFAGAFYAAKLQAIFPELFKFNLSVMILCMVILGGMGNIWGVAIGAFIVFLIQTVILKQLNIFFDNVHVPFLSDIDFLQYQFLLYGIALVAMMLIRPEGLFPSRRRRQELHAEEDADFGEHGDPMGSAPE